MAKDYNAINFKNKDIDKFAGKFGQGDPVKSVIEQVKDTTTALVNSTKSKGTIDKVRDTMNTIANSAKSKGTIEKVRGILFERKTGK